MPRQTPSFWKVQTSALKWPSCGKMRCIRRTASSKPRLPTFKESASRCAIESENSRSLWTVCDGPQALTRKIITSRTTLCRTRRESRRIGSTCHQADTPQQSPQHASPQRGANRDNTDRPRTATAPSTRQSTAQRQAPCILSHGHHMLTRRRTSTSSQENRNEMLEPLVRTIAPVETGCNPKPAWRGFPLMSHLQDEPQASCNRQNAIAVVYFENQSRLVLSPTARPLPCEKSVRDVPHFQNGATIPQAKRPRTVMM
mmetsp:Transcript_24470/g.63803  ORF Transcript_24470/g.63803 Transcript_24470/m.63803 type:complete len:257 (-) Transcript_24470:535-1305(-)